MIRYLAYTPVYPSLQPYMSDVSKESLQLHLLNKKVI